MYVCMYVGLFREGTCWRESAFQYSSISFTRVCAYVCICACMQLCLGKGRVVENQHFNIQVFRSLACVCMYVCVYIRSFIWGRDMLERIKFFSYSCVYVCICMHAKLCICMYACICMCVCIYTHIYMQTYMPRKGGGSCGA